MLIVKERWKMGETLDEFAQKLQEEIFEETRKAYGEAVFQRWLTPRFMGALPNADGKSRVTGKCGDTMEFYLKIANDRVETALFWTDGCGSSTACGSMAAELAHGKTLDELADIDGELILQKLGGLPQEEQHCAYLAAGALQEALRDYFAKQRQKGE